MLINVDDDYCYLCVKQKIGMVARAGVALNLFGCGVTEVQVLHLQPWGPVLDVILLCFIPVPYLHKPLCQKHLLGFEIKGQQRWDNI